MSEKNIFDRFVNAGMTPEGAAGTVGNAWAESNCESNRKQGDFTADRRKSKEYTQGIDSGAIDFNGRIGYGLFQWTFKARQINLLNFARKRGVSVGNENMQIDFAIWELKNEFSSLWRFLCSTDDIYKASERFCKEFERPAYNNVDTRYKFALAAYERCKGGSNELELSSESVYHLQSILKTNGFDVPVNGIMDDATKKALNKFNSEV